jgi:hypothetical protein
LKKIKISGIFLQNLYRLHKTIKIENFNERKDKFYLKIWRQNQKLLGDVSSIFITEFRKKNSKKKFRKQSPFFQNFWLFKPDFEEGASSDDEA